MITVKDIYDEIDRRIHFAAAEEWDNCGILAGDPTAAVTGIITALDITREVIREAEEKGAQLIISHHPIIFRPIRSVLTSTPTGMLLQKGLSAICCHTPFDMSPEGMAKGLFDLLETPLGLIHSSEEPLEKRACSACPEENLSIGKIYRMREPLSAACCAERLKEALGCRFVRFSRGGGDISKIAVCSGAGGSVISEAAARGADGLVSGDFKHDEFIDAPGKELVLFDCGHFHTERIFGQLMADMLSEAFPNLEICAAESCADPAEYV